MISTLNYVAYTSNQKIENIQKVVKIENGLDPSRLYLNRTYAYLASEDSEFKNIEKELTRVKIRATMLNLDFRHFKSTMPPFDKILLNCA